MLRAVAPAAVLVLILAGCGGTPAAPSPDPTEAGPEPTPTPTESASDQLFIGPDGIGTMHLGEPVGADDTFMVYDPAGCADLGIPAGEPYAGFWRSGAPGELNADGYEIIPFWAMTDDGLEGGPVSRVSAGTGGITTAEGIGIGSSIDDVITAYSGEFDEVIEDWASDVYVIEGEVGRLTIEVTKETADGPYWEPEQLDTVLVLAASIHPAVALAGGDGGGPCPL